MSSSSKNENSNKDPRLGSLIDSHRFMLEQQDSCDVQFRIKPVIKNAEVSGGGGIDQRNTNSAISQNDVNNGDSGTTVQINQVYSSEYQTGSAPNPNSARLSARVSINGGNPENGSGTTKQNQTEITTSNLTDSAQAQPSQLSHTASASAVGTGSQANVRGSPSGQGLENGTGQTEANASSADVLHLNRPTSSSIENGRPLLSPTGEFQYDMLPRAHLYVLKARCPELAKTVTHIGNEKYEIEIAEILPKPFYEILRFLYYEKAHLTVDNSFPILKFSHHYNIPQLASAAASFIRRRISPSTVCDILENSIEANDDRLISACTEFISKNTRRVLNDPSFLLATERVIDRIASLDYLGVKEIELLDNCVTWARQRIVNRGGQQNLEEITGDVLKNELKSILQHKLIRFPTMTAADFSQRVVPLGILNKEEMFDIYNYIALSSTTGGLKANSAFPVLRRHFTGLQDDVDSTIRPQTPPGMPSTVFRNVFFRW